MHPALKNRLRKIRDELRIVAGNTIKRPSLYRLNSPERIGAAFRVPSDMCATDRIMLYALIRGLRPERVLEIGVRWGGSARIIANALEDNGRGEAVGLDPELQPFRPKPAELHGRYKLCEGYSPQDVPKAAAMLSGAIDFAFIDALHTHDAVYQDFSAVIPFLAPGAHVLMHDTYHQGIDAAVREVIDSNPGMADCGFLSRSPNFVGPIMHQGLRLVRCGAVESHELIAKACIEGGRPRPRFDPYYNNWDDWANGIGLGVTGPEPPGGNVQG